MPHTDPIVVTAEFVLQRSQRAVLIVMIAIVTPFALLNLAKQDYVVAAGCLLFLAAAMFIWKSLGNQTRQIEADSDGVRFISSNKRTLVRYADITLVHAEPSTVMFETRAGKFVMPDQNSGLQPLVARITEMNPSVIVVGMPQLAELVAGSKAISPVPAPAGSATVSVSLLMRLWIFGALAVATAVIAPVILLSLLAMSIQGVFYLFAILSLWLWVRRLAFRVVASDGEVTFHGLLRKAVIRPNELTMIHPGKGFVLFETSRGQFRQPGRVVGLQSFIVKVRQQNPAVQVLGF